MVFSSVTFLFLFLPIVLAGYFVIPRSWRNGFLLAASLVFYAWGEVFFVLVMLASVVCNYFFGRWLIGVARPYPARRIVLLAVLLNVGLLGFFKYSNFFVENLNVLLGWLGLAPLAWTPVRLPIGISFFTFQALTYVVDVYRGNAPADRSFTNVALYIALFPQLIAGPIVRFRDIAAQLIERTVTRADFAAGVRRFLVGLGKKVLIANTVGEQVDAIYSIPAAEMPAGVAWLGGFYFMLQLYFDFSAYSDMAIGLGRMFGFKLLENFNYPYIARSITEFWQRWHISLSTWFRDYLFNPLGGYRCSRARAYVNLMIVFLLCGLWHGASWNFVLFGAFQGAFLIVERIVRFRQIKLFQTPLGNLYVLLVVFVTMVIFRTDNLAHTADFLRAMAGQALHVTGEFHAGLYLNIELLLVSAIGVLGSAPTLPALHRRLSRFTGDGARHPALEIGREAIRLVCLFSVFLLSAMKLAAGTHNPFIYFRF